MECLHPLRIINPSKYVSLNHSDRYATYVKCGKCAACQESLSKEWYLRSYVQFRDCVDTCGYVLFDCLTYSPKFVPRLSNFVDVPRYLDFTCFDYRDFQLFMKSLRIRLERLGYNPDDNLRFFVANEYGTKDTGTHRPHMHLLLFVYQSFIDPLELSALIADTWEKGRTDGIPYRSRKYVLNNAIGYRAGIATSQRVCKYVAKYVNKSSAFQSVLDDRLNKCLRHVFDNQSLQFKTDYHNSFEAWLQSIPGKQYKRKLISHINQFHRQSLHYGESLLADVDINEIIETNIIKIPDNQQIVSRLGLPLYYKRKLFYELVFVDGLPSWQPTDLGLQYLAKRKQDMIDRQINYYNAMNLQYGLDLPAGQLADYVVNHRGRIKGVIDGDSRIEERLKSDRMMFNYTTECDRKHYQYSFIADRWHGNKLRYYPMDGFTMSPEQFIEKYVYFDSNFEMLLSDLENRKQSLFDGKQQLYDGKQRLMQIYKSVFPK